MNIELEKALNTFATLLPDYFPEDLGNPNDLHRWMDVCYVSCVNDSYLSADNLVAALKNRFPDFTEKCVEKASEKYMRKYSDYCALLDYLKSRNLLSVNR